MVTNEAPIRAIDIESIHARGILVADLDLWDSTLTQLNLALVDAARSRDSVAEITRLMDIEEARIVLGTNGNNAETRKAAVTVALAENLAFQDLLAQSRETRLKLADSERRAELARQRTRLLREAVRLQVLAEE